MTAVRAWWLQWLEWLLIGLGVGCLATVGYQSVDARRFQAAQSAAFARAAHDGGAATGLRAGSLVGMLDVPRLKLTTVVVEGDEAGELNRAAGHLPDTPFPWQGGNSAIAAHRDSLFRPLKDVKVGDEIHFRTTRQKFVYRVTHTQVVSPDDLSVLAPRSTATLTLITCYPFSYVGSAPKRFVVHAERVPASDTAN